jgi:hypothetical protein
VSPMMTVVVLTILWLVVVVPMIVRKGDDAARTRTMTRFRGGLRTLGRAASAVAADSSPVTPLDLTSVTPHRAAGRPRPVVAARMADAVLTPASRRPEPAAEEATMRSAEQPEMSAARLAMLRRRRRTMSVLGVGSAVTVMLAFFAGGPSWLIAAAFLVGLGGYLYFLRRQALSDRERRAVRQLRAAQRPHDVDRVHSVSSSATSDSVVRIDDDDFELHAMDTVDLTGLYQEQLERLEYAEEQRRAG